MSKDDAALVVEYLESLPGGARHETVLAAARRWQEAQKGDAVATIDAMVDRFLSWPLPNSVRADLIATQQGKPHRSGTNLLTAVEARQMIEYVLRASPASREIGTAASHWNKQDEAHPAESEAVRAEREACAAIVYAKHLEFSARSYPPPTILIELWEAIRARGGE